MIDAQNSAIGGSTTAFSREQLAKLAFAVFYSPVLCAPQNIAAFVEEIDCHPCDHVSTGGTCYKSERGDYCPNDLAETLRQISLALYGPGDPSHYVASVFGPDKVTALSAIELKPVAGAVTESMVRLAGDRLMRHGLNAPEQEIYRAARSALEAALQSSGGAAGEPPAQPAREGEADGARKRQRAKELIADLDARGMKTLGDIAKAQAPVAHMKEEDWRDDPSADERWNAGLDYGLEQLCICLDCDPKSVSWDAATETLDGDVRSVIGNILRAKFGEDWASSTPPPPANLKEREAPTHRHVKSGHDVTVIATGKMQAQDWAKEGEWRGESNGYKYTSVDLAEVIIYRHGSNWWVRPREEFEDGRFVALPSIPPPPANAGEREGWRSIPATDETVEYVSRYGGRCRDCADNFGTCPGTNLPCVPADAHKAIRHVLNAINYGFEHGFLPITDTGRLALAQEDRDRG